MWDWAKSQPDRGVHPERAGERDGQQGRESHRPRSWEAHRRHRNFDERGVIQDETHEAVRIRYDKRASPDRQLAGRSLAEVPLITALLIASIMHGAVAWAWMATVAFTDTPWAALAWIPIVWIALGRRFLASHLFFFVPASALLLAFDGWIGWAAALPIAALMGPGRWLEGER